MKKKVVMIGAGLTLGSALLISSAFADMGGAKGYETYKAAVKETARSTSATQHIALSLKDNGSELLHIGATMKESETDGAMSGKVELKSGAVKQSFELYGRDGRTVIKADGSDTYTVIRESDTRRSERKMDREVAERWSKEGENVIDALVGNLKNYVQETGASGGSRTIDVQLSGSQIPAAVNAIGSIIVKEALSGEHREELRPGEDRLARDTFGIDPETIIDAFPELTSEVNIDRVGMQASIGADNRIDSQQMDIAISGKDASGAEHQVVLSIDVDLADLNATTPDTIDLAGKKVRTIDETALEEGRR